jgi:hypothetical protein
LNPPHTKRCFYLEKHFVTYLKDLWDQCENGF